MYTRMKFIKKSVQNCTDFTFVQNLKSVQTLKDFVRFQRVKQQSRDIIKWILLCFNMLCQLIFETVKVHLSSAEFVRILGGPGS